MNTEQRVRYLDLYRRKLQTELTQMEYDRIQWDPPAVTVSRPGRPASAWAAGIALLILLGVVANQAL